MKVVRRTEEMKLIAALLLILLIFLASTLATYQGKVVQEIDSSQMETTQLVENFIRGTI